MIARHRVGRGGEAPGHPKGATRLVMPVGNPALLLIGIYEPRRGCSAELLADKLAKALPEVQAKGCIGYAVLKSRSRASLGPVAIYAPFEIDPESKLPKPESIVRGINGMARVIQVNWYERSCEEHKEGILGVELSKGGVVHLRGLYTEPKHQDIVSYSCLALLKAYFGRTQGLHSLAFYDSLDKRNMVGLGVWEDEEAAITVFESGTSPALPYWKSLDAKAKHGVYEVVDVLQFH